MILTVTSRAHSLVFYGDEIPYVMIFPWQPRWITCFLWLVPVKNYHYKLKKNIELNSFITHNDSYKLSELWVKHLHLDDPIDLPLKASFKRLKEPPPNPRVTTVRCTAAPLRLLARLVEGRRWRWSRGGNALHQQRALREENGWCLWCIWFVWYVNFLYVYIYICGCVLSNINMCIYIYIYMCVYVLLNIYVCVFYLIYIYICIIYVLSNI